MPSSDDGSWFLRWLYTGILLFTREALSAEISNQLSTLQQRLPPPPPPPPPPLNAEAQQLPHVQPAAAEALPEQPDEEDDDDDAGFSILTESEAKSFATVTTEPRQKKRARKSQ